MEPSLITRYGGVVPLEDQGEKDSRVVALSASSPALLGDRVVVRVVDEALLPAEILTQELLGLTSGSSQPVGASITRAVGFPAWPMLKDPDNAHHALNLVADLEWARRLARGSTGKVAARFDELAQVLAQSTPHFIPTLFEELARIFDSVGSSRYAIRYFGKAREIERAYGLEIDPQRHREVFLEFGRRGLISAKELAQEAASCARRFDDPAEAYEYFFDLNIDRMKAGGAPYVYLVRDLIKLGRNAGLAERDIATHLLDAVIDTPGMRKAPLKFLVALATKAGSKTAPPSDQVIRLLLRMPTGAELDQWCDVVLKTGVLDALRDQPQLFREWLGNTWNDVNSPDDYDPRLREWIVENSEILRDQPMRVSFRKLHIAYLAELQRCGVQWEWLDSAQFRTRHLYQIRENHAQHEPPWDLSPLFQDAEICERLLHGYSVDEFLSSFAHVLYQTGNDDLVAFCLRREIQHLSTTKLLPALQCVDPWLGHIRGLDLPSDLQDFMVSITDINAADVLRDNLRAGLLTEFTWPALERQVQSWRSSTEARGMREIQFYPSYPGIVVFFKKQCVVIERDQVVAERRLDVRQNLHFAGYFGEECDVLQVSESNYNPVISEWSSGAFVETKIAGYFWRGIGLRWNSVPLAGGRLLPSGVVMPGQSSLHLYAHQNDLRQVFTTSDGRAWRCDAADVPQRFVCHEVDPATGNTQEAGLPSYLEIPVAEGAETRVPLSTVLAAPHAPSGSIVALHEGNIVCVVSEKPADSPDPLRARLRLGDGTEYACDVPVIGAVQGAGVTLLVDETGKVYLPNIQSADGQLACARDGSGAVHWLHRLPWSMWVNLRVRDHDASRRLREITSQDAQRILDALDNHPLKRPKAEPNPNTLTDRFTVTHSNCKTDSDATRTVAEILGSGDPELCASVVQLAMEVAALAKRFVRNHKFLAGKRKRNELAAEPEEKAAATEPTKPAEEKPKPQPSNNLAARECEQLANAIQKRPGARAKRWVWMHIVGNEKPYLMWAQGPLVPPEMREFMREFMRSELYHDLVNEQWRHILVNWQQLARVYGKSHMGMIFPATPTVDAVLVQRGQKYMKALITGTPPKTIANSPVVSHVDMAEKLGISVAMSRTELQRWVDEHEQPQEVDISAWLAEMQPYIDAVVEHCALTPRAAKVLLAGGFNPSVENLKLYWNERDDYYRPSADNQGFSIGDQERFKASLRKLSLTKTPYLNAVRQLEALPQEKVELLLAAAYDRNLEAVTAIAKTLRQAKVPMTDEQVDLLLGWYTPYSEKSFDLLLRAANPLPAKATLQFGMGYGRVAGAVLHWATHAEMNDPLRGFYADQLEALKTIEDSALDNEHLTKLPLQGKIVETDYDEYPWLSPSHNADAIRAIKEGVFDNLIASLRRPAGKPGCVMDPRTSASETVAAVQQQLGLNENAATYFLQLLCLVECTDRNIKRWNGWRKKEFDQARAELLAAGLVVEGKRSRAGRTVFFDGMWLEASNPHMPMEEWKIEYYLVRYNPKAFSVVPWCPPILPAEELFAAAWKRYTSGDVPRYEALTTKRYRKRR